MHVAGIDQHPVAGRQALDRARARSRSSLRSSSTRSAIAPTWRWERPEATIMVSAIEVLPARSISTVSSAFMSSRQARATARISSSCGGARSGGRGKRRSDPLHAEHSRFSSRSSLGSATTRRDSRDIAVERVRFQCCDLIEVRPALRRSAVDDRASGARAGRPRPAAAVGEQRRVGSSMPTRASAMRGARRAVACRVQPGRSTTAIGIRSGDLAPAAPAVEAGAGCRRP